MSTDPEVLYLYHGGRLDGPVEVRPQAKKDMQHGPGFYVTDDLDRARRYAKGGKRTYRVKVKSPRLASEVKVPLAQLEEWVKNTPRLRNRSKLLKDLQASAQRVGAQTLPANYLINLALYHEAIGPKTGPQLAAFMREVGAQATRARVAGETWWTIFDPDVVLGYEQLK